MAFANTQKLRRSYIVESTFGTTPAGNFIELPSAASYLNLTKSILTSNDTQPDRMARVERHGNSQTSGDIPVELRAGVYDDFLASAMMGDWVSNVLKVGSTPKYFSIEEYFPDIDIAKVFTGQAVSQMAVSIGTDQMVNVTFGMVGKDMTTSATQKTVTSAANNAPFDSYSGALSIGNVGAGSPIGIVSKLDFTVNNSLAPIFVIGSKSAQTLEYGRANISGTMTAYFADNSLVNRFLNEVESELEVSVDDPTGTNAYTFLFPRIKINGAEVSSQGESNVLTIPFTALWETTEGTSLKITRPTP